MSVHEDLQEYQVTKSGLYNLLSSIVSQLSVLEQNRQKDMINMNIELEKLRDASSKSNSNIAQLHSTQVSMGMKIDNISFAIQGYTARSSVSIEPAKQNNIFEGTNPKHNKEEKVKGKKRFRKAVRRALLLNRINKGLFKVYLIYFTFYIKWK